ncbi:MAG: M28 family peptidase [Capsulimonadaceae bacterium]
MKCHPLSGRAWRPLRALPARNALLTLPVLLLVLMGAGCHGQSQTVSQGVPAPAQPAPPVTPAVRSDFDGERAYADLVAQCNLGVRPPGSQAHEKCRTLILQKLTPFVDKVDLQPFTFHDPDRHVTLHMTNIIGVINPAASRKVLIFTHWDTRPTADQDLLHKDRPIMGADDGASGTAAQIELARCFHKKRPTVGVILLFVDGEDWGPGEDRMYLGARYFAAHPGIYKPAYAILLDMIGQKDVVIYREVHSEQWGHEIDDKIWSAARALGYSAQFPDSTKYDMGDDHVPFNEAGIEAVDLIDFDYPYWHTLDDTADKCSAASLKTVGDVVAKVIYDEH